MCPELEDINVNVKSEGVEEASEEMQDMGDGDGGLITGGDGVEKQKPQPMQKAGGGNMIGKIMNPLMSMSTSMMAVLGGVLAIAGILLSMEPIQKMLKAFMKVVQAFFTPLAMMLIKLLSPILRAMIRLLPLWLKFWQDPIGGIKEALQFIWNQIKRLPQAIWSLIRMIPRMLWAYYVELPQLIWSYMKQIPEMIVKSIEKLPGKIAEKLTMGLFQEGGMVSNTGPHILHRGEAVVSNRDLDSLIRTIREGIGGGQTVISMEGGLGAMIEQIQKNPNR